MVCEAKSIDSKLFSLPRLLILSSIENLGSDGATYRDLRAGLELKDGTLHASLKSLKQAGYAKEHAVKVGEKTLRAYYITEKGKQALQGFRSWLAKWVVEGE
jgi:DNA-binding PadR family transcriptional regulator